MLFCQKMKPLWPLVNQHRFCPVTKTSEIVLLAAWFQPIKKEEGWDACSELCGGHQRANMEELKMQMSEWRTIHRQLKWSQKPKLWNHLRSPLFKKIWQNYICKKNLYFFPITFWQYVHRQRSARKKTTKHLDIHGPLLVSRYTTVKKTKKSLRVSYQPMHGIPILDKYCATQLLYMLQYQLLFAPILYEWQTCGLAAKCGIISLTSPTVSATKA